MSSTRFGSIKTNRTSSGVARIKIEVIIALIMEDLPAPVAPATSKCGILARFAQTKLPSTSLPRATSIGWWSWPATLDRITSPRATISRSALGISIPTADLPGIGERMRTSLLATAYEIFLARAVIFSTFTALPSSTS